MKPIGRNVNVKKVSAIAIVTNALQVGLVVGMVLYVLLVPHAVRRVSTGEARQLLPLCALFGAGFVTLCDTIARVAFAPYELPVGIIMAFLGAPFFLFILVKGKGGHSRG